MVRVPLPHPHREGVDVLVQLVEQSDALDDHVVRSVDVELDLAPGVGVTQTQLGLPRGLGVQVLDQLVEVEADAADDFRNDPDVGDLDPEALGDGPAEFGIQDTEDNLLQLLGHVGLKEVFELRTKQDRIKRKKQKLVTALAFNPKSLFFRKPCSQFF